MSVFHPPGDQQLKLSDICQQGIEIVNRQGETLTEQPGDSCAYILQLSDKSSGIAFLKQKVSWPFEFELVQFTKIELGLVHRLVPLECSEGCLEVRVMIWYGMALI